MMRECGICRDRIQNDDESPRWKEAGMANLQAEADKRAHSGESNAVIWTMVAGRIGYTALGVVFTEIAIFMVVAALRRDPNQARDLGGALRTLLQQPFGPYLLGLVALGLTAFGLFSLAEARYRRVGRG
jgi:hypothetical protein